MMNSQFIYKYIYLKIPDNLKMRPWLLVLLFSNVINFVTSIHFNLVKGEKTLLRWNIVAKEDLIIQADFAPAPGHTIILNVKVGENIIFGTTSQGSNHIRKTIQNPFSSIVGRPSQQYYWIEVQCQSRYPQVQEVWNLVSLKMSSDFKSVIYHNIKKQHTGKTKEKRKAVSEIRQFAEGIGVLAREHQQMQSEIRDEENEMEKRISGLTDSLSYLVILQIIVISLCTLLQIISFRSYLIKKHFA